jgi:hypothetical protein
MIQKAYEKIGELENRITELEELVNGWYYIKSN